MHPKVFVKLKKTLKTLSSGQKTQKKPKKTQKTQKKTKKPKKNQKNPKKPTGLGFFKKTRVFSNPVQKHLSIKFSAKTSLQRCAENKPDEQILTPTVFHNFCKKNIRQYRICICNK